ncbi:BOLL protein, partial [Corythaeola cristata]|nr:BOLL protein [Corythaeola cristata]
QTANQTQTESLSSSPSTLSPVPLNNLISTPRFGTVTPNRIFVGGIDFKISKKDLSKFRKLELILEKKSIFFRYGFITFETQEDAQRILQEAKKLNYKDKKLNIGPAVRKQQIRGPRMYFYLHLYIVCHYECKLLTEMCLVMHCINAVCRIYSEWFAPRSVSSSPVMIAQPIYQSPAYHYQAPTQCLPSQWQWSVQQPPASSPSVLYLQPSEVVYQPIGITQESGCIPPLLVEAAVPELYSDHGVQAPHHQPYTQGAMALPAPV